MSSDNLIMLAEPGQTECPDHLVDLFCGCGGSGGGLLDAAEILDRRVQGTFVNHWDKAIQIHSENHPEHRHLEEDLFLLDPAVVFPGDTHCSLLWASPQCTFFSVARGASCVNEQDRSHANHLEDWVDHLKPEGVLVENVREFKDWGPVIQKREWEGASKGELMWAMNAKPCYSRPNPKHPKRNILPDEHRRRPDEAETAWVVRMMRAGYQPYEVPDKTKKGEYFDNWQERMKGMGYYFDHRILKSADYGDPTIRQRLFIYMVRKGTGKKVVWPKPYAGEKGTGHDRPMNWRTARDIIDWTLRGKSIFTERDKPMAKNTQRRLSIGVVKYALRDAYDAFLVTSAHGSPKPEDCERRVHSLDKPAQTLTQKGERGLVQVDKAEFILPKDGGHKQDYVRSVDHPAGGITTKSHEVLVQTECSKVDMIDHIRGTGVCRPADEPTRGQTAGGSHQALAEAFTETFMFQLDQTGGTRKNDGTYSADTPVKTLVTKANQSCITVELEAVSDQFLQACDAKGVDTTRATSFLDFLMDELKRKGHVDAKPWIYVYYSSGSEGKHIEEPLPAVRTKAGHALVYPVIELDGKLIKIDLFYRMLTPLELQRAMGFPDDMSWAGCTKTQTIRAIGNSVSRGVARALGVAWYAQDENVWEYVKHLYETPE